MNIFIMLMPRCNYYCFVILRDDGALTGGIPRSGRTRIINRFRRSRVLRYVGTVRAVEKRRALVIITATIKTTGAAKRGKRDAQSEILLWCSTMGTSHTDGFLLVRITRRAVAVRPSSTARTALAVVKILILRFALTGYLL